MSNNQNNKNSSHRISNGMPKEIAIKDKKV
jgi:hypothetical protein